MTPCPAGQIAGDDYACVACAPGKYKLVATEEIPDLHPCFNCLTTGEWAAAGTLAEKCSLYGFSWVKVLTFLEFVPRRRELRMQRWLRRRRGGQGIWHVRTVRRRQIQERYWRR